MASRAYGVQMSSGEIDLMPLHRLVGVVIHFIRSEVQQSLQQRERYMRVKEHSVVLRSRKCQTFQLFFNRMLGLEVQECVMIELLLLESEWVGIGARPSFSQRRERVT